MNKFNYALKLEDYEWKKALLWGNFIGHCKKATVGSIGNRVVHVIIALIEALPIIGQIASLFETFIVKNFGIPSPKSTISSSPNSQVSPSPISLSSRKLIYIAIGSNMKRSRIEDRIGAVKIVGTAIINDYEFGFTKLGADGSGKGNILPKTGAHVEGVVFELSKKQLELLDKSEGYPIHYGRETVSLNLKDGRKMDGIVYVANPEKVRSDLRPTQEYYDYVLEGAQENNLSHDYLLNIKHKGGR